MKVCIIGGVAGGAGTAARLRRNDETAEIVLFEKGEYISFANCGLPYYIGGVITEKAALQLQTPQSFHARFNVDVRVQNEVLSVDPVKKEIAVRDHKNGRDYTETYDKLVVSPGASPVRPPLPGLEKNRVFTLRNIPDTYAIKEHVETAKPKTAAVIGGGFIGVEMAENLHSLGVQVSIIEATSHVIASLDDDMAHDVHNHIRSKGVGLVLGAMATELTADGVILKDGRKIPAEMVILSVGVRPETEFLKSSGLEMGRRGEILVDEQMRTNLPDVFAVGDAVTVKNAVTGQPAYVPLASPANRQARVVADVLVGKQAAYTGVQGTAIAKVFDMSVATTGESERTLKAAGISYHKTFTFSASHAGYYPGGHQMLLKLLFDDKGVVLGAQIAGYDGVDKRIDVLSVAVRHRMTVWDLQEMELAYAPPFSSAKDPVNMAGYTASNVLDGTFDPFYIEDIEKLPADAQLVDVRTKDEYERGTVGNAVNIPVDEMRDRLAEMDKSKKVYIFCQVGLRGYIAERIAAQNGFDCCNLSGGYRLYAAAETDKRDGAESEKSYEYCGKEKE